MIIQSYIQFLCFTLKSQSSLLAHDHVLKCTSQWSTTCCVWAFQSCYPYLPSSMKC